jgi:uncharacterized protein
VTELTPSSRIAPSISRNAVIGVVACLMALAVGLTWAKWSPYLHRVDVIDATHAYPGSSLTDVGGHPGDAPSLSAGWDFTVAYMKAIWQALVVALVVAAAIQAMFPRRWLVAMLSGRLSTMRGGLCSLPMMMCTCCTAPLTVTLRRSGVGVSATLAYWLGNPTLNPAVIAFLAILLPWQWVATRVAVGALLVFVVTAWIGRVSGDRSPAALVPDAAAMPDDSLAGAPLRFARALARLCLTLVPEYLVVVFAVGALHGWLFPFDGHVAVWGVLLAAVVGTLMVIPTAGEIPILQGLAAAGAGPALLGTLLIALPAVSLPSLAMVARALTLRVTLLTGAAVAATSLLGGLVLLALT